MVLKQVLKLGDKCFNLSIKRRNKRYQSAPRRTHRTGQTWGVHGTLRRFEGGTQCHRPTAGGGGGSWLSAEP